MRRDAEEVRRMALKDIPPERRALVLKAIADSFDKEAKNTIATEGYQSIGDDGKVVV